MATSGAAAGIGERRARGSGALRDALRARARIVVQVVVWLVPLLTLLVVVSEWNGIPGQPLRDTSAYHAAAEAARTDGDIYDPLPPPRPHDYQGLHYYLYPPPLAALLALLPETRLATFDRMFLLLNLVAFWVFAASAAKIARHRWSVGGTLRWGAALFFVPGTWLAIHFGNIELVILTLVALGIACAPAAGACLLFGAVFKISPVWAFLVRSVRAPRQTLPPAAAAALVCAAASFLVFGVVGTFLLSLRWMREVLPVVSQGQFWGGSLPMLLSGLSPLHFLTNLSLSFMPVQVAILNGWDYDGGVLPGFVRFYLTAVAVLAPLTAAWLTRRRSIALQTAVVFAAALLSAPIVRPYVLPVLLLVLAAARGERRTPPAEATRA